MSFDWSRYLTVAHHLYEQASTQIDKEACYRAAISRAYYACFHAALSLILKKNPHPHELFGDGRDHRALVKILKHQRREDTKTIGITLEQLLDKRQAADYEGTAEVLNNLHQVCQDSIVDAELVVKTLVAMNPSSITLGRRF